VLITADHAVGVGVAEGIKVEGGTSVCEGSRCYQRCGFINTGRLVSGLGWIGKSGRRFPDIPRVSAQPETS
jgi:hypothetical protein